MQIVDDELARDLSLLLLLLFVVIVRRRLLLIIYYIRFTFVYYTFFFHVLEHARKRENEQTKRPTFSTAPRSSPETGPNRPRPPPCLVM